MSEKSITNSIFEEDWWLNAVAGNNWERIVVQNNNHEIVAAFPIFKSKRFGFRILKMPPLTQTLGLYISDTGAKLTKKMERDKGLINDIIGKLPQGYKYDFHLDVQNEYVLPFVWKGFNVEPRFTYVLDPIDNINNVWKGLKENIRTDIRKAERRIHIRNDMDISVLIDMQEKTFKRQNRNMPYDRDVIRRLDDVLKSKDSRILLCAVDDDEKIHAATYFVYDERRFYYLLSGGDPDYRRSGATSLLVWEGIRLASEHSKIFDFEGSMIEDIERFVRGFGAHSRTYYRVQKMNCFLCFIDYLKPRIKKIIGYK